LPFSPCRVPADRKAALLSSSSGVGGAQQGSGGRQGTGGASDTGGKPGTGGANSTGGRSGWAAAQQAERWFRRPAEHSDASVSVAQRRRSQRIGRQQRRWRGGAGHWCKHLNHTLERRRRGPPQRAHITVDPTKIHQVVDGFGLADVWQGSSSTPCKRSCGTRSTGSG
jgi:hypothetical protein